MASVILDSRIESPDTVVTLTISELWIIRVLTGPLLAVIEGPINRKALETRT